jgi:hypothetical protein
MTRSLPDEAGGIPPFSARLAMPPEKLEEILASPRPELSGPSAASPSNGGTHNE